MYCKTLHVPTVQMTEPAALHCSFPGKPVILWRKSEHLWAYDFGVLPRPRDTLLSGGGRRNRVDGPYTWPMQYQVPVTLFFWNGSEGIQHPLYHQQHFSLCFTSACLEFTLAESCFEPTHQHKWNLNTAVSVCKVYLRDVFSIMKHSSSCINVSLWHRSCG